MIEYELSDPQYDIMESMAPINLFLAGVGSGKTHLAGYWSYKLIYQFPQCFGFVAANTYDQLNTSTLFRIRSVWKSMGVTEWSKENPAGVYVVGKEPPPHFNRDLHNFDRYNNIISFVNGCIVFTGSLDNAKSHEGKEFAWCVLDETKDSRESDIKEIILARLRQPGIYLGEEFTNNGTQDQQVNPLLITTSPAKVDWINEWFKLDQFIPEITSKIYSNEDYFKKRIGDKFVVISSTYHNVQNVGINYIKGVLDNNTEERGKALIFANPFTSTGGEFYSSFNRLKHVDRLRYDPAKPLHISFDQNTVPYNSASIWQVYKDGEIWCADCVDEITLHNPRNSTEEVCEEFMGRYPRHTSGLFYYGDASGRARSTMNRDFKHHYEIVEYKLRKYLNNVSDRTMISNPSVVKRRDFINRIFEDKLPAKIKIGEECKHLINDLMYLKQDIDGTKKKEVVTDKETGDRYQKYGHLSDGMDYFLVSLFEDFYD